MSCHLNKCLSESQFALIYNILASSVQNKLKTFSLEKNANLYRLIEFTYVHLPGMLTKKEKPLTP